MEPWESGSWAWLMFSDSKSVQRWERSNRSLWKNTGGFSNTAQWLQQRYSTPEHPLYKVLALQKQLQVIPTPIQCQKPPSRLCSPASNTCSKYLQQMERLCWDPVNNWKNRMHSLCHLHRTGMAQFESLFSVLFMKDALSHTPTMLLSWMISFLTFKLKN